MISDGPGASDDSSGGGNASGSPDADTAMRPHGNPPEGNVEEDRHKLFPETIVRDERARDENRPERDESNTGG